MTCESRSFSSVQVLFQAISHEAIIKQTIEKGTLENISKGEDLHYRLMLKMHEPQRASATCNDPPG